MSYSLEDFNLRDVNDQQSLGDALAWASYKYYVENDPPMSDYEFDMEFKQLQRLEAESGVVLPGSPTQRVGSDLQGAFQKHRHRIPMQSIENVYTDDELQAWFTATAAQLHTEFTADDVSFTFEPKYDGLSISLVYKDGHLVDAVTRGNQVEGESVIENVRTIRNVPLELRVKSEELMVGSPMTDENLQFSIFGLQSPEPASLPSYFEVRGEVLMPQGAFDRLNAERSAAGERPFANKRNAASGSLKQLDPKVTARRGLIVMAYAAYTDDADFQRDHMASQLQTMQLLDALGFDHYPMPRAYTDLAELTADINTFNNVRTSGILPYDCDGVVVKVNERRHQEYLGLNTTFPNWCKARKFPQEARSTRMLGVTFQVGMTGHVTPVAELEPVAIGGSVVARATLNNESYIRALGLRVGQYVFVQKAGEVIPQVTGTDAIRTEEASTADDVATEIAFPTQCPECGTLLQRKGEYWICPNHHCRAQVIQRLEYWCGKDCAGIRGLGPAVIADFVDRLGIRSVDDLYRVFVCEDDGQPASADAQLSLFDVPTTGRGAVLRALGEGYAERSVAAIYDGVRHSIATLTLDRIIGGLGIDGVGKVMGRVLAAAFGSLDGLRAATLDALTAVDGVGEVIARNVLDFLATHMDDYTCLGDVNYGFHTTYEAAERLGTSLDGLTIIFTGTSYRFKRDEIKAFFTAHGAKYVGSVSGKVDYLVVGDAPGQNKVDKARSLGVPVVAERDFYNKFNLL